jgi:aryl carrier-like protein
MRWRASLERWRELGVAVRFAQLLRDLERPEGLDLILQ